MILAAASGLESALASLEGAGVAVVVGAGTAGVDWVVDDVAGVCAPPDVANRAASSTAIPRWLCVRMRTLRWGRAARDLMLRDTLLDVSMRHFVCSSEWHGVCRDAFKWIVKDARLPCVISGAVEADHLGTGVDIIDAA
jgi:hypothetical protein